MFLVGKATSGGDDSGGDDSGGGAATTVAPGGEVPFPTGDQNRTGYWGFANLEPIVVDTFDRANDPDSLGAHGHRPAPGRPCPAPGGSATTPP